MPYLESECSQKWDRNQLCVTTDAILSSAVPKQQHPVYPVLHSHGNRRTLNMGSIDKLLKYWNLFLLRACLYSLMKARRRPACEMKDQCINSA